VHPNVPTAGSRPSASAQQIFPGYIPYDADQRRPPAAAGLHPHPHTIQSSSFKSPAHSALNPQSTAAASAQPVIPTHGQGSGELDKHKSGDDMDVDEGNKNTSGVAGKSDS
jgi:hypothetical protein